MLCNSCDALSINGVLCHEQGCPEAWKDTVRECKWCGDSFIPETQFQICCCDACARATQAILRDLRSN